MVFHRKDRIGIKKKLGVAISHFQIIVTVRARLLFFVSFSRLYPYTKRYSVSFNGTYDRFSLPSIQHFHRLVTLNKCSSDVWTSVIFSSQHFSLYKKKKQTMIVLFSRLLPTCKLYLGHWVKRLSWCSVKYHLSVNISSFIKHFYVHY